MPDFRIIVDLKDVGMGDAEDVAQSVYDEFAEPLDAKSGEFRVLITEMRGNQHFTTDWEPNESQ